MTEIQKDDILYPGSTEPLARATLKIQLSDTRVKYSRSKYTLFILLGDFGGFNGAVLMFPAMLLSLYSQRMFTAAVA